MATTLLRVEDLETMGETVAHRELIRGELQAPMASSHDHTLYGSALGIDLGAFVRARGLGRVYILQASFVFDRDVGTVLIPDVAFVRADRVPGPEHGERIANVVPDLVAEILSPNERRRAVEAKLGLYQSYGVRLIWLLDPRTQSAMVYRPNQEPRFVGRDGILDGEDVVPGYQLQLADLFA